MTLKETAQLLAVCSAYWPEVGKSGDSTAMAKAWQLAMSDITASDALRAVVELAKELKFAPRVSEIREKVRNMGVCAKYNNKMLRDLQEMGILEQGNADEKRIKVG